jgi:hypothetical protein
MEHQPSGFARFWRLETFLFLGVWLIVMVFANKVFFRDPGSLWHIVVGEQILETGEFIRVDAFSFTAAGEPWIAQQWLGEVTLALLHRIGGLDTILLACATFLAGLYTWVGHRLLRAGLHPGLVVALVAWSLAASCYHFHPRPHLLTIALVGWTYTRLCDFEAGRLSLRQLFWLIPVFLVWANVHGGMLGGLAMLVCAVSGWALWKWLGQESPLTHSGQLVPLGVLVLACGLTALINPYGVDLLRVWWELSTSSTLSQTIMEHRPLLTFPGLFWVLMVVVLFYLSALLGVLPRWPRVTWLIPLLWLIMALTRVRHGPLFTITAVLALGELLPQTRWARWLASKGSVLFRIYPPRPASADGRFDLRPALIPAGFVLASLLFHLAHLRMPLLGRGWAQPILSSNPIDLLPDLRQFEGDSEQGVPIFNDMLYGGFLIYHTPGFRVFIDDRCELYQDERLLEYANALWRDPSQIDSWANHYDFHLALVANDSSFDRFLTESRQWIVVRRGKSATLYRRVAAGPQEAGAQRQPGHQQTEPFGALSFSPGTHPFVSQDPA